MTAAPAPATPDRARQFVLARSLFLRGVALVYFIAFVSCWAQVDGLFGEHGVLPVRAFLTAVESNLGDRAWLELPTLLWLWPSADCLHFLCGAGIALSIVAMAGFVPAPALIVAWILYLSIKNAGQTFFRFQWDALLLEAGLHAVILAPWLRLSPAAAPRPAALWLVRWLLVRFMLLSGLVKLDSGDATWQNLTALQVHYWTQPLPTWIGWHVHHLPTAVHVASCAVMFAIELGVPLLALGPPLARRAACAVLVALQVVIAATGNYGFFNLLTAVLCIPLLDDVAVLRFVPGPWRARVAARIVAVPPSRAWRVLAPVIVPAILLPGLFVSLNEIDRLRPLVPDRVQDCLAALDRVGTINGYGLFRVMTTDRREIVIEGSDDGREWREYEFRWKPGDVSRAPAFVAPHMPRLDWQMWFAALSELERNRWLVGLFVRLLEARPRVLALLAVDPFAGRAPRYLRATLWRYRFATPAALAETGGWWTREPLGPYCPVIMLEDGRPVRAPL